MRKYVIAILLTILIVLVGVNQVQSNVNSKEVKNKSIDKKQQIVYTKRESKPIDVKIKENNNYIIMRASAYTKSIEEGTHKGITKSGTQVSRGTVSVDPDRIPLGTKLYIENYGYAVAEDTGGAIKDNRIDLYMESKEEAFEFGRREVKVWIVE